MGKKRALRRFSVGRETSLIFAADDFIHFLRRFLAAAGKPHFDDRVQSAFEKFHVVCNVPIVEMLLGELCVILFDFKLMIVTELEINEVERLVFFYVAEEL